MQTHAWCEIAANSDRIARGCAKAIQIANDFCLHRVCHPSLPRLRKRNKYHTEFASQLTHIKSRVRDTVISLQAEQRQRIKDAEQDLLRIAEWKELTQQEQNNLLGDLEKLAVTATEDLAGLRTLVNQEYSIQTQLQDLKNRIQRIGQQRLQDKLREEQAAAVKEGKKKITRSLQPKRRITSMAELNQLITQLEQLRGELQYAHEFELEISLNDSTD